MKKKHLLLIMAVAAVSMMGIAYIQSVFAFGSYGSGGSQSAAQIMFKGKVVETMNSGGYTYVQIDTGSEKVWAAGPQRAVKVGDKVSLPQGMAMNNYHSKTLNRDFEKVYFVGAIMMEGEGSGAPAGMSPPGMSAPKAAPAASVSVKKGSIKKAKGGKTVDEIFKAKADLDGKDVTLRGKVVKFTSQIMGKNWIHVQDGTGAAGTSDLTVTTAATVKAGDTVLLTGKLAMNKDFGYGYKYDVIIEDAKVKVE